MSSKKQESNKKYYLKNKDKIKAKSNEYYQKNKDRILKKLSEKHKQNPEIMRARVMGYYYNDPTYKKRSKGYIEKWKQKNPEQRKKHVRNSRIRAYGISPEQYKSMLEEQGNCCAICKQENKRAMAIDHDHKTGKVRGLLCDACNLSLGHIEKDGFLEKALKYIAKYK